MALAHTFTEFVASSSGNPFSYIDGLFRICAICTCSFAAMGSERDEMADGHRHASADDYVASGFVSTSLRLAIILCYLAHPPPGASNEPNTPAAGALQTFPLFHFPEFLHAVLILSDKIGTMRCLSLGVRTNTSAKSRGHPFALQVLLCPRLAYPHPRKSQVHAPCNISLH